MASLSILEVNAQTKNSKGLPKGSMSLAASDTWLRLAEADQRCRPVPSTGAVFHILAQWRR